ncbi:hypothetical protein HNV11_23740 (plasmid) [Spirosoma taeanense]|uniref:Uncharacterized protein n=1 Tax=Spirosoma taeanense TaxID=2735870 RepID=A0A6M5YEQ2_9BACT|nr:hypothetical protein [Spirosoma taeanense]QJW92487.1 hypothetical protein HNV11_23740 [Spirosoma taeanense]
MNSGQIEYETETTELDDYADLFSPNELTGARIAADAKAKVTFEYMNNEGEVITREWETITLWYYGSSEPTPGANTRYQKPRSIVKHPANNRSYTRKSLLPGWYMIQLDDRSTFQVQKFEAGSDGLYVFNDQGSPGKPLFSGYYSSYGKIKFTFGSVKATKTKPAVSTKAQAFLTLTKNSLDLQFWLYNDRTTGSVTKSLFWFMPAGVYSANWYGIQLQGDSDSQQSTHKSGTIIVAPGKTYPNIKL